MFNLCASLRVTSNTENQLPMSFTRRYEGYEYDFVDQLSERVNPQRNLNPRYRWVIEIGRVVVQMDVLQYLNEVFEPLTQSNSKLFELLPDGYKYFISLPWESNGTGAGPLLNEDAIALLSKHRCPVQFGFYRSDLM
jgi:hypothetical protein